MGAFKKTCFFGIVICVILTVFSCNSPSTSDENIASSEITDTIQVTDYSTQCAEQFSINYNIDSNDDTQTDYDREALDCQISFTNSEISVSSDSSNSSLTNHFKARKRPGLLPLRKRMKLFLLAEIDAPKVNGEFLGATDVEVFGKRAVVTYNTAGETYRGAVQIIDLSNPKDPYILSQIIFPTIDISSAYLDDQTLLLAEAQSTDITGFESGAQIRLIDFKRNWRIDNTSSPVDISSFVTTDILSLDDEIYVTSGNTGGLTVLDAGTLDEIEYIELDDARSLTYEEETDSIFVYQGTPGRVTAIDLEEFETETFKVGGGSIAEAKSTITSASGYLFIGASDGGTIIVDPVSGDVLDTIENPDRRDLDDDLEVTNAVSVDNELIFISNGEAGIRVAQWSENDDSVATQIAGTLNFDNEESANAISYRGKYLVVASGIGGVKIVRVYLKPYLFPFDCDDLDVLFCDDFSLEDGTVIDSRESELWSGKGNVNKVNATVINEGGRLNRKSMIKTIESFDDADEGLHFSIKLYRSTKLYVGTEKRKTKGTEIRYDGEGNVLAIVGNTRSKSKRTVVSFDFPSEQDFIVAHVYQRDTQVQVVIDLADGTRLNSEIINSKHQNIVNDLKFYLEPYDSNAQPYDEPSFDDVLVEEWEDDFISP